MSRLSVEPSFRRQTSRRQTCAPLWACLGDVENGQLDDLEKTLMDSNSLYYGDNLDILRRYVRDESADLIYLDPPFNSNQTYNILFQEKDGSQSASQIQGVRGYLALG